MVCLPPRCRTPSPVAMPGAGKKRQQSDRRRGGGAGGGSRDAAETASASVAPPVAAQEPEPTTPVQADRPMGYDGANSPPPAPRDTSMIPTSELPRDVPLGLGEPFETLATDINRRLDLPSAAYNLNKQVSTLGLSELHLTFCNGQMSRCHWPTVGSLSLFGRDSTPGMALGPFTLRVP